MAHASVASAAGANSEPDKQVFASKTMDEFEKIQGALEVLGFSVSRREDQNVKRHVMTDENGPTWASVERRVVFNKDD
eukprot:1827273-Amphidinium_carterae.1